jgi:hypothetical protein
MEKKERKLSKSEKAVIKLLEKIDEISNSPDFNCTIFGNAGYSVLMLTDPTKEQGEHEYETTTISKDRIVWKSRHLVGDGGDPDIF